MSRIIPAIDGNTLSLAIFKENGLNELVDSATWSQNGTPRIVKNAEWGDFVFEGNSSAYYVLGNRSLGNPTFEAWVYIRDNKRTFTIVSTGNGTGLHVYAQSGNVITFDDGHRRASTSVTNGWHHIAVCYHGTTNIRCFVDGGHRTTFGCGGHGWRGSAPVYVGGGYNGTMGDGAYIAAVRISNTPRWSANFNVDAIWKPQHIGLAVSKSALNFIQNNVISRINILGAEPEGTKRRFAFKISESYVKLNTSGNPEALPTQAITADSLLAEGNTAAELDALTDVPGFVGKLVYPVVALYAPAEAAVMPSFGMTVNAGVDTAQYTRTEYSQEYHLSDTPIFIVSAIADVESSGGARADITVRIKNGDEWSAYMPLNSASMQQATDMQIRAVYSVDNVGSSDSVKVNSVTVTYTSGTAIANGVTTDIVTTTQHFTNDLNYVYALVKHKELMDAKIKAFVSLRDKPGYMNMKHVGYGTGDRETYQLAESGINQSTLVVYANGIPIENFSYNTEASQITLATEKDAVITASYEFGWSASEWIEMTYEESQVNDSGDYTSRYTYEIPGAEQEKTVTAIKYQLLRPAGSVSDEVVGEGTGKRQIIQLPHYAKKETIKCTGAWSYDYDSRLLTVIADEGQQIVISYDYIAESPRVFSVMAGWTD